MDGCGGLGPHLAHCGAARVGIYGVLLATMDAGTERSGGLCPASSPSHLSRLSSHRQAPSTRESVLREADLFLPRFRTRHPHTPAHLLLRQPVRRCSPSPPFSPQPALSPQLLPVCFPLETPAIPPPPSQCHPHPAVLPVCAPHLCSPSAMVTAPLLCPSSHALSPGTATSSLVTQLALTCAPSDPAPSVP